MSLVETVSAGILEHLDELAQTIEGELKSACPARTGQARSAIHIEKMGEQAVRIGGTDPHLFFADQGNNQRVRVIRPVRAKALHFSDGTYHSKASTYEGHHFVKKVADRHR